jgi:hypothetical protein
MLCAAILYDTPLLNTTGIASATYFDEILYDISVDQLALCDTMHAYSKQMKKMIP